ncbi:hypothetical protein HMI54_010134, partial [Coelomomyces lativittatus]
MAYSLPSTDSVPQNLTWGTLRHPTCMQNGELSLSPECAMNTWSPSSSDSSFKTTEEIGQTHQESNSQIKKKRKSKQASSSSLKNELLQSHIVPDANNTYFLTSEDTTLGLSYSPGTVKPFVCKGCSRRWKGRNGFSTHLSTCPRPFDYSSHTLKSMQKQSSNLLSASSLKVSKKRKGIHLNPIPIPSQSLCSPSISECPSCYSKVSPSTIDTHFCQQPPLTPSSPGNFSFHLHTSNTTLVSPSLSSPFTPSSSLSPSLVPQVMCCFPDFSNPPISDSYPSPPVESLANYEMFPLPCSALHEKDLHWGGGSQYNAFEEDGIFNFSSIPKFSDVTLCSAATATSETLSYDLNYHPYTSDCIFPMWDAPFD